jgi:hypothetical protein
LNSENIWKGDHMSDELKDYIEQKINDGYLDENLNPLLCPHCDSPNIGKYNVICDEHGEIEYDVDCNDCTKHVGNWSYGSWDI